MRRRIQLWGRRGDEIAKVDMTFGAIEVVNLTDNGARKVLMQMRKNGVSVEMALSPAEAADFAVEYQEALDWLASPPFPSSQQPKDED